MSELDALRDLVAVTRRAAGTVRDPRLVEACRLMEADALDALADLQASAVLPPLYGQPEGRRKRESRLLQEQLARRLERARCQRCGVRGDERPLEAAHLFPRPLQAGGPLEERAVILCAVCHSHA